VFYQPQHLLRRFFFAKINSKVRNIDAKKILVTAIKINSPYSESCFVLAV
jgi:hypothetical protein